MSERGKNSQSKVMRLGRILKIMSEKDKLPIGWLSRHFDTTTRTIQRDIRLLKLAGFPIYQLGRGVYSMKKDLVKNMDVFDDTEMAMIIALKNVISQLGESFKKAADSILERLNDCMTGLPMFIKIEDTASVDGVLLGKVARAIVDRKEVSFSYRAKSGTHPVLMEPYRVVNFGCFWYLIGKEKESNVLKRYALDRINLFRLTKKRFYNIPQKLDSILHKSANIWFEEESELEVVILVENPASDYFKRKRIYLSQEIVKEHEDGSLTVKFQVGKYEAIRDFLKSWIPHILVIKPV
ncbi:MAG: transcriptional regulator [Syntrophales bacterium]|nr:transcriptional regulator [Syntrophales bacterium]